MNLYFAISAPVHIEMLKKVGAKKLLCSYAMKKMTKTLVTSDLLERTDKIIIDSGAFSAWTKGITINLDEYIEFCKWIIIQNPCNEVYFVNLDKIPGSFGVRPTTEQIEESAQVGLANYKIMKEAGLKVIPVFHQHEDFKWLEMMMEQTDYIGISPANDVSVKQRVRWLGKVFSILKADYKTHLFGFTSLSGLMAVPAYSADSTSWLASARYGTMNSYDSFKVTTRHYKHKDYAFKMNLSPKEMEHHIPRTLVAIKNSLKMESDITRLWEKRGIYWDKE